MWRFNETTEPLKAPPSSVADTLQMRPCPTGVDRSAVHAALRPNEIEKSPLRETIVGEEELVDCRRKKKERGRPITRCQGVNR